MVILNNVDHHLLMKRKELIDVEKCVNIIIDSKLNVIDEIMPMMLKQIQVYVLYLVKYVLILLELHALMD